VKRKWLLMTEEIPLGEEITTVEVLEAQRKCLKQPALTAVLRLRCLSSPTLTDQFIAETAFQTTGNPGKTVINTELIDKISIS
jgi:hypothetical protein